MKKTKEFFVVLFSILICVFLVVFIVQATTTISTNIVTEGTVTIGTTNTTQVALKVAGSASVSEELWASGSVQFGGGDSTATVSYSRFGAGDTGHGLSNADDLLVTGLLEVDATASFDNAVSISAVGILMDEGVTITSGTASISGNCVIGSLYLRTGTASVSIGWMFNMCTADNTWTNLTSSSSPWE